MTKQEWQEIREALIAEVKNFEKQFDEDNCRFVLDSGAEDPEKCIVKPLDFKYRGFYVFSNEFFNIYVDGWFHNCYGWNKEPAWKTFPRGYKSGLQKVIKQFCEKHNLYYELRKAYRATVNPSANTCAFLIAINK
jgi:hypothetical protein